MSNEQDTTTRRDPWGMQRLLMEASDQPRPAIPVLSKNSLLYLALILEETAETINDGVVPAMQRSYVKGLAAYDLLPTIRLSLDRMGTLMANEAEHIRGMLRHVPDFDVPLNLKEARGCFDGTTDIAVVNCGFALACGLLGKEGYDEVADSNLSKCNPDTGKIDKTPDGKWIKGRNFKLPNLDAILMRQVDVWVSDSDPVNPLTGE